MDKLTVTVECSHCVAAIRAAINSALDELEGAVAADSAATPRFDALGRSRWLAAENAMDEHGLALRERNSRIGTLAYFGDLTPTGVSDYALKQWRHNTESAHVVFKNHQAYVFAKNADGQWEANTAMHESQGHEPTLAFVSQADADAHLRAFLERELGLDPDAPQLDRFTHADPVDED